MGLLVSCSSQASSSPPPAPIPSQTYTLRITTDALVESGIAPVTSYPAGTTVAYDFWPAAGVSGSVSVLLDQVDAVDPSGTLVMNSDCVLAATLSPLFQTSPTAFITFGLKPLPAGTPQKSPTRTVSLSYPDGFQLPQGFSWQTVQWVGSGGPPQPAGTDWQHGPLPTSFQFSQDGDPDNLALWFDGGFGTPLLIPSARGSLQVDTQLPGHWAVESGSLSTENPSGQTQVTITMNPNPSFILRDSIEIKAQFMTNQDHEGSVEIPNSTIQCDREKGSIGFPLSFADVFKFSVSENRKTYADVRFIVSGTTGTGNKFDKVETPEVWIYIK